MPQDGKHLYEAGWDPGKETNTKFEAKRDIDWRRTEERNLARALRKTGYEDPDTRDEILQSAISPSLQTADGRPNWQKEEIKAGTKFYALTTVSDGQHGLKSPESAYWLSEAEVGGLEREKLIDRDNRTVEAAVIKNRYALPCTNRVNGLVETQVTQDHQAVQTTVGPGKDVYTVDNEERSRWMEGGGAQWHPNLSHLELDRSRNVQKLAEQDGRIADYQSYKINYSRADSLPAATVHTPKTDQRDRFGAKVEECHKALSESRQARDYDPAARAEYTTRKAEMDGHTEALAKDPSLLNEITDERTRKSMQERVSRHQNQHTASSSRPGQNPELH